MQRCCLNQAGPSFLLTFSRDKAGSCSKVDADVILNYLSF